MGHEWQASYWKHPPLPPWMAEIAFQLFGRTTLGPGVLTVLCSGIALWLIWRLSRSVFGVEGGLIALILTLGSYYLMMPMTQFNHNLAQWPFWAATLLVYRSAALKGDMWRWLLLGIVAWGLIATKYTGGLLLVAISIHALATAKGRAALRRPGPYLAIAVMFALSLPQIIYIVTINDGSLAFPFARPAAEGIDRLLAPLTMIAIQIAFAAPALMLVATSWLGGRIAKAPRLVTPKTVSGFDRSFLLVTFFLPLALSVLIVIASAIWSRDEALGSMFIAMGPAILALRKPGKPIPVSRFGAILAGLIIVLPPIASGLNAPLQRLINGNAGDLDISYRDAAEDVAARWDRATDAPLDLIIATFRDGGRIAVELQPQPSVMIDGMFSRAPWVTPERIAAEGALIAWIIEDAPSTCNSPPERLLEEIDASAMRRLDPVPIEPGSETFCLAMLPPAP